MHMQPKGIMLHPPTLKNAQRESDYFNDFHNELKSYGFKEKQHFPESAPIHGYLEQNQDDGDVSATNLKRRVRRDP